VLIFGVYTWIDHQQLDAATAFASLALVSQVSWSIGTLPDIFNLYANLKPSGDRLADFFSNVESIQSKVLQDQPGVTMIDARIGVGASFALFDVSFCVRAGELVIVTGAVGSGKTSLLMVASGARQALQVRY